MHTARAGVCLHPQVDDQVVANLQITSNSWHGVLNFDPDILIQSCATLAVLSPSSKSELLVQACDPLSRRAGEHKDSDSAPNPN